MSVVFDSLAWMMAGFEKLVFQVQKFVVCWQYLRVRLYHVQECLSGVLVFIGNIIQSAVMTMLARLILRKWQSTWRVCFGTLRTLFLSTLCFPDLQ